MTADASAQACSQLIAALLALEEALSTCSSVDFEKGVVTDDMKIKAGDAATKVNHAEITMGHLMPDEILAEVVTIQQNQFGMPWDRRLSTVMEVRFKVCEIARRIYARHPVAD